MYEFIWDVSSVNCRLGDVALSSTGDGLNLR
jgi:hypothetical protein